MFQEDVRKFHAFCNCCNLLHPLLPNTGWANTYGSQFPAKKLFRKRQNKTEWTAVSSEFRLFRETKNFRNSVPRQSSEPKNTGILLRIIPKLKMFVEIRYESFRS